MDRSGQKRDGDQRDARKHQAGFQHEIGHERAILPAVRGQDGAIEIDERERRRHGQDVKAGEQMLPERRVCNRQEGAKQSQPGDGAGDRNVAVSPPQEAPDEVRPAAFDILRHEHDADRLVAHRQHKGQQADQRHGQREDAERIRAELPGNDDVDGKRHRATEDAGRHQHRGAGEQLCQAQPVHALRRSLIPWRVFALAALMSRAA